MPNSSRPRRMAKLKCSQASTKTEVERRVWINFPPSASRQTLNTCLTSSKMAEMALRRSPQGWARHANNSLKARKQSSVSSSNSRTISREQAVLSDSHRRWPRISRMGDKMQPLSVGIKTWTKVVNLSAACTRMRQTQLILSKDSLLGPFSKQPCCKTRPKRKNYNRQRYL